jgi:hypothetical protein
MDAVKLIVVYPRPGDTVAISSGRNPIFLVAGERVFVFQEELSTARYN